MNRSRWEATRSKGLLRFVLLIGMCGWGISVAIFSSLVRWAISPDIAFVPLLARALILFPLGGVLWALCVWFWTERAYARQSEPRNPGAKRSS